jgi:hypothetical protein
MAFPFDARVFCGRHPGEPVHCSSKGTGDIGALTVRANSDSATSFGNSLSAYGRLLIAKLVAAPT